MILSNYIQEKYLMLYQIGLILMLVALALIIGKRFKKTDSDNDQLIYEDEMSSEELDKLDDEIN
jgi:hypothetical protein